MARSFLKPVQANEPRILRSVLFEVSPADPTTLIAVSAIMLVEVLRVE